MCGIVGYTGLGDKKWLARMNRAQTQRGPDDQSEYWNSHLRVGLGMTRLIIRDRDGGRQPMMSDDGSLVLVFNGEVFNAIELRSQLESSGVKFKSDHSDTELLLRSYETYGEGCLELLNGMFAFVLLDMRKNLLIGARDPFGIKPLYFMEYPSGIGFASELKGLRYLPAFSNVIDPIALRQYFGLQYIAENRTIFSCAKKIRPGHYFSYCLDQKQFTEKRYYQLPLFKKPRRNVVDEGDIVTSIREGLEAAVDRWSISDVPIACSLSGGLDSAVITALMARAGRKVSTFTLGFRSRDDDAVDERVEAKKVADMYSTDHHEIVVDERELLKDLPMMVSYLDEPYGGGLPSWYVYREVSKQFKVVMTGTGSDELFSNYNKYSIFESNRHIRLALMMQDKWKGIAKTLSRLNKLKNEMWRRPADLCNSSRSVDEQRLLDNYLKWIHPLGLYYPTAAGSGFNDLIGQPLLSGLSPARLVLEESFSNYSDLSIPDRCTAVDFETQLPNEFLFVTDRFSMAHSVEARTPFLDREFVETALGIASDYRLTPKSPKSVLRNAFGSVLPRSYANQPKRGFVLPTANWLRGPLKEEVTALLSRKTLEADGYIRPDFSDAVLSPFFHGDNRLTEGVWTAFMFRLWQCHGEGAV